MNKASNRPERGKSLRNRYLPLLGAMAFLILSVSSFGQIHIGVRQQLGVKGYNNKEGQYDSILVLPRVRPTNPGTVNAGGISIDTLNKRIWFINHNGQWDTIKGGTGG